MHYHSPQYGEPGLRVATHPPHGETNLPSTSTLPEPSNQPQSPSATASVTAPAGGRLDRMQTEVQALQQQAQATQQSIKKLQARESTDPLNTILSDLPAGVSSVDSTMLGIGSGLVLAAVIVWWYVWHRPRTRWIDAPPATAKEPPISTRGPLSERNLSLHAPSSTQPPNIAVHEDALAWADPNTVSGDTTQPFESGHSPFARHEPNMEFDPEVAASEVTRVRKSLAEKREARAQLQDREDSVSAALDLDLDLYVDDTPAPTATETPSVRAWLDREIASKAFVAPAPAPEESVSFSLAQDTGPVEPEPEPEPDLEPPAEEAPLEMELVLEAESLSAPLSEPLQEPEPQLALVSESIPMPMEHESGLTPAPHESGSKNYDFTITLALAQESATLELWTEARDLASEVMESDDPKLVSEALSLLERLNQIELEAPVDTPTGNGAR
nr:hypothetical protein [Rhodoferax sp.]